MLVDQRLISWYRTKLRLMSSWHGPAAQPGGVCMNRILPEIDSSTWALYREQNAPLVTKCVEHSRRIADGALTILSAGTVGWRKAQCWDKHPITGADLPGGFRPYNVEHYSGGDINLALWVNSLPFLPSLANAYLCTGHASFVDLLCQITDSWLKAQRPAVSVAWDTDLTVAFRASSILYTQSLVPGAVLPASTRQNMARIVRLSGSVLDLMVERPSFNHRVIAAFGLFCCGLAWKQRSAGKRWIEKSASILFGELERQFFGDGVHGERSPGYMKLVIEAYLHFRALGQHHGLAFPPDFDQRLIRSCEALDHLCDENAVPAFFGDDSDLNLFSDRTAVAPLALAAVLFRRADFKARARCFPPAAFWLLGGDGYRQFQSLPDEPLTKLSYAFRDAGYYIMESPSGALRMTCGAELTRTNGHSHADTFGFELHVEGDRVLVDAGTYAYFPSREWRDYFRSTRAHNTVTVDEQDQAAPLVDDHFGWSRFPKVQVHQWRTSESHDFLDVEHDGYGRLTDPVVHRRRVLYVKSDYWVIVDDLLGRGVHVGELFFQFASGEVLLDSAGTATARRPWGNLEIRQLAEGCEASIVTGQEHPIRGWISNGYGHRAPAASLCFARRGALPMRFCSVILPTKASERITVVRTDDGIEVIAGRFSDRIRIPANLEADAAMTIERLVPAAVSQ